jgi:hypothetical protein
VKKVSLFTSVAGAKYIAKNKVCSGGNEIFCGDSNTKEILNLEII